MRKANRRHLAIILIVFLLTPFVSALTLTEVELNPPGSDSGNEWIEFQSNEETNLNNYTIKNNDGQELKINKTFEGFFVYTFTTQWLDNTDEKIFIYKNNELIQETKILEDSENNDKTWTLCNDNWQLKESSRQKENQCEQEQPENKKQDKEEQEEKTEQINNAITQNKTIKTSNKESKNTTPEVIYLTPQNIKNTQTEVIYESSNEKIKSYAIFGFIIFCILLAIFLFLNRD